MAGSDRSRAWAAAASLAALGAAFLLAIAPGLRHGFWEGHDSIGALLRVDMLLRLWQSEGLRYPHWFPDAAVGYGYPFFTFYPPLGYFAAALLAWLPGVGVGLGLCLSFWLAWWTSGLATWGYAWRALSRQQPFPRAACAFAAGVFYMLAPYHLTEIYLRSALSQSWAWAAVPALFWAIEVSRSRRGWGILLVALACALLMLAHNAIALYAGLLAALYVLLTAESPGWVWQSGVAAMWGLALSAFYWLPAYQLLPMVRSHASPAMLSDPEALRSHAVYPRQYFMEAYGRGFSLPGIDRDFAINPGIVLMLGVLLGIALLILRRAGWRGLRQARAWLFLFAALVFAMSPLMPWEHIPVTLRYLQFPWRLLVLAVFAAAAFVVHTVPGLGRRWLPLIGGAVAVLLAIRGIHEGLYVPAEFATGDDALPRLLQQEEVYGRGILGTLDNEYLPVEVDLRYIDPAYLNNHPVPPHRLSFLTPGLSAGFYEHRGLSYAWTVDAPTAAQVKAHMFFFPGWQLRIDGASQPSRLFPAGDGLVQMRIPPGRHRVILHYAAPAASRSARWLSLLALALWIGSAASRTWLRPRVARMAALRPFRRARQQWLVHLVLFATIFLMVELSLRFALITFSGLGLHDLTPTSAPPEYEPLTLPDLLFRTEDPDGAASSPLYQLRPDLHGVFADQPLRTDSVGRRLLPLADGPATPTVRFALLGSDAAFGWGVPAREHFAVRLARDLAAPLRAEEVQPVVVAVPGHTPAQQIDLFLKETLVDEPAFVLYQFDLDATRWSWCVQRPAATAPILMSLHPGALLRGRLPLLALATALADDPPEEATPLVGWDSAQSSLEHLATVCAERQIPVFLFTTRSADASIRRAQDASEQDRVIDLCRHAGVRYLPVVEETDALLASGAFRDGRTETDRASQAHPNRAGHLMLLTALAPALVDSLAEAGLASPDPDAASDLRGRYLRELQLELQEGLHAPEDWGRPVQWTQRRSADIYYPESRRLKVRYYIGKHDITPENPLVVQLRVPGVGDYRRIYWQGNREDTAEFDLGEPWPAAVRLETLVSRTFREGVWGRDLGIALFPPEFE